jgi:hypothetical protein
VFDDRVIQLLRDDRMRGFLIDVETDSTIQPDEDAEKQRRTEFVTAFGGFMKEAGEILPNAPRSAPMIRRKAGLLFMVRGLPGRAQPEEVIERSMQQLGQQMQQPKPSDPENQAEGEAHKVRTENELRNQNESAEHERKARDADRGKPKKSIAKVLRDKDGKMTGAEISH